MKILVLEDCPLIQNLYKEFLKEDDLFTCAYGKEAVSACEEQEFDALILDIGLPDGSGLDFGADILDCHENLPILINSASSVFDPFKFHRLKNHKNLMLLNQHIKGDSLSEALTNFKSQILEHLGYEDLKKNISPQRH